MKRLITNADDFGLNTSITDAIIDTHINGIMTSTTLMTNMEGTDYAIQKAKEIKSLGVGIHFNLTEGKPLSELSKIPLLIDKNGNFKSNIYQRKNLIYGKEKQKQVEIELSNQLIFLLDNGIVPTHFDSHHHITGTPLAFKASLAVCKKYKVTKARITNIDYNYSKEFKESWLKKIKRNIITFPKSTIHNFNKKRLRAKKFITPDTKILPYRILPIDPNPIIQFSNTLNILKNGSTEISFHPGYKNAYHNDSTQTAKLRLRDLDVAKSKEIIALIKKLNIELISFRELQ